MKSQLPFATIALAVGLYIGDAHPVGVSFLFLSLALLWGATMAFKHETMSLLLAVSVWVGMGAVRANCSWGWAEEQVVTLQEKATEVNQWLTLRLAEAGLSEEAQALCSAITLGNKSKLSRSTRQLFSLTGASHLLAISGLHVGLIFLLVRVLLRQLLCRWRTTNWSIRLEVLMTIGCISAYAFITGLQPSVVRAWFMLTMMLLSVRSLHQARMAFRRLVLSVFLMLLIYPPYLYQLGFWLSILAVSGIILLYMPCMALLQKHSEKGSTLWGHIGTYLGGTLCVSLVAQIFVTPLLIYYFHNLPLLGWLWSLFLIPFCTLLLYASLLTLVFPHHLLGELLNTLVGILEGFLQRVAEVPFVVFQDLYPTTVQVGLLYALLAIATLRLHQFLYKKSQERIAR